MNVSGQGPSHHPSTEKTFSAAESTFLGDFAITNTIFLNYFMENLVFAWFTKI